MTMILAAVLLSASCSLGTGPIAPGSLSAAGSLAGASFTVGSKEFTEQEILCHITSLALRSVGATVTEKCGLAGSNTARTALTSGGIDLYWEYTGTAWISFLQHTRPITDPAEQYKAVAQEDLAKNHLVWLDPAPFNSTYALAVKSDTARSLGVRTISDYARLVTTNPAAASTCVASEFVSRDDGLPGLEKAYGFEIPHANTATLNEEAIYHAVATANPCVVGEAIATDGRIEGLGLTLLEDDKHFFPVYNPAPVVPQSVSQAHPQLAKVIHVLAAALDTKTIRELNEKVDIEGQDESMAAQAWLEDKGFIGK
ncbi:MAG: glycine betaine ABC transporter substrate-binding protein [Kutzneria sp.]|nr:glycine betaine ABC transporter substrate-binding protein [Kutzneria sp.]